MRRASKNVKTSSRIACFNGPVNEGKNSVVGRAWLSFEIWSQGAAKLSVRARAFGSEEHPA